MWIIRLGLGSALPDTVCFEERPSRRLRSERPLGKRRTSKAWTQTRDAFQVPQRPELWYKDHSRPLLSWGHFILKEKGNRKCFDSLDLWLTWYISWPATSRFQRYCKSCTTFWESRWEVLPARFLYWSSAESIKLFVHVRLLTVCASRSQSARLDFSLLS